MERSISILEQTLLSIKSHYDLCESVNEALEYVAKQMNNVIFPMLEQYENEAKIYCQKRDLNNSKIQSVLDEELHKIKKELSTNLNAPLEIIPVVYVVPMTSFTGKLHLEGHSDVDIAVCVRNMYQEDGSDNTLYIDIVTNKLRELGYNYTSSFGYDANWTIPKNRYISYGKIVDDIEVEIKIRDWRNTQPLIDLHEKIDKNLTVKQQCLYTYAKLLLKGTKCYPIIKLFIYLEQFSGIEGAFKLPAN